MNKKLLAAALFLLPFSNATAQQPVMAADINPGSGSSHPRSLTTLGNTLYFTVNNYTPDPLEDFYKFDGTTASKAVNFPSNAKLGNPDFHMPVANNELFFVGPNSTLWQMPMSGTATEVADSIYVDQYINMTAVANKVYFIGGPNTSTDFFGLMSYDAATSTFKREYQPVDSLIGYNFMAASNGKIYFTGTYINNDRAIYGYDPATNTGDSVSGTAGNPNHLYAADNNKLYYINYVQGGEDLFAYSGAGTPQQVTSLTNNFIPGAWEYDLIKMGNNLFFAGNDGGFNGTELYKLDVVTNTPTMVKDINIGTHASNPDGYILFNNKLYFSAKTDTLGTELWMTDGTAAGTTIIADLNPGAGDASPTGFAIFNNKLYFNATDGTHGFELYGLSGTAGVESVTRAKDITVYPNPASANVTISLCLVNAENLTVTLTDATGKTVYTSPLQQCVAGANILNVPTQHLPTAVYQYRIANDKNELIGAGSITRR